MGILHEQISGTTISVDITSTNLKSAIYETGDKTLTVTFNNGSIYEYYEVPWTIFTKFRMSESQGKFFSSKISKVYKYIRL